MPLLGWAWLSDREIVVSTQLSGRWGLARLRGDASPSRPVALAGAGESGIFPSIALRAGSARQTAKPILAYERVQATANLYSFEPPKGPVTHPLASSSRDGSQQLSPDGQSMVFVSDRSGPQELWKAADDGSHPVALTTFGADSHPPGSPKRSPDGRQIVFDVSADGHHRI